jgi:hypothetical protein
MAILGTTDRFSEHELYEYNEFCCPEAEMAEIFFFAGEELSVVSVISV